MYGANGLVSHNSTTTFLAIVLRVVVRNEQAQFRTTTQRHQGLFQKTFCDVVRNKHHSLLRLFTGLANAALTLWKPTVRKAISTAVTPAIANIHQAISMR